MNYFFHFPKTVSYASGKPISMVDITIRVKILEYVKKHHDSLAILDLKVKDGQRPEEVSMYLYDTFDYTWTILLLNNIYNVNTDWPLSWELFQKRIINEFGSVQKATEVVYKNYNRFGYECAREAPDFSYSKNYYDYLFEENERKKNIRFFDPTNVERVQYDFEQMLLL